MNTLLQTQLEALQFDPENCSPKQLEQLLAVVEQTYNKNEAVAQGDNKYKKLISNLERRKEYYFYIYYPLTKEYDFISSSLEHLGYSEDVLFENMSQLLFDFENKTKEIKQQRRLLLEKFQDITFEISLYDAQKNLRHLHITEMPILDKNNLHVEAVEGLVRDVTKEKNEHDKIIEMAKHDTLTKLLNRLGLEESLRKLVAYSKRYEKKFALIFLDLDKFKQVNDTYGHNVGDKLLQEVALRIGSTIREEDLIARLGGDEFVVVLTNIQAKNALFSITKKLLKMLSQSWVIDGIELDVTASMGVAIYPDDTSNLLDLFHHADLAMYNSKENGRGRVTFYREKLNQKISQDILLEQELPYAIEANQLELYYQPIYKDSKENIFGCEALLRWNHPEYGTLLPNEFLALAEQSQLISKIDRWVVQKAIEDTKMFVGHGICVNDARVSINISAKEIVEDGFYEFIRDELQRNSLEAKNIAIEVVNYSSVKEYTKLKQHLYALKQLGIESYIGNFDIDLGSLSAIESLPISTVKIEKDIISKLSCKDTEFIYSEIISTVCKHLSKDIIIEGIENEEHSKYLEQAGCNKFQGFLYSKPMKKEDFIYLFQKGCN